MPLNVEELTEEIERLVPGYSLHYFRTLPSTMIEATRLAQEGAPTGTVVVADEQTAGIGRLGRSWTSEVEVGIYCSILLGLPLKPADLPIASLLLGLATAEAIQKTTALACDLRWPNDVLIKEHKVAGILPHLVGGYIVAGIGINVNNTAFEPGLRTPAISLRMASSGQPVSREAVLLELLHSIENFSATLKEEGPSSILRAFTHASSYVVGRRVMVEESGAVGVTAGLDEHGFLLLRSSSGTLERIASGGVRPVS